MSCLRATPGFARWVSHVLVGGLRKSAVLRGLQVSCLYNKDSNSSYPMRLSPGLERVPAVRPAPGCPRGHKRLLLLSAVVMSAVHMSAAVGVALVKT